MDQLKQEVHRIAGSSGSYGFHALSEAAIDLENELLRWYQNPDDAALRHSIEQGHTKFVAKLEQLAQAGARDISAHPVLSGSRQKNKGLVFLVEDDVEQVDGWRRDGPLRRMIDDNFVQYAAYVIRDRAIPELADGERALMALSLRMLPPVLAGLMLAAVISAILSTVSSQLLVAASAGAAALGGALLGAPDAEAGKRKPGSRKKPPAKVLIDGEPVESGLLAPKLIIRESCGASR